jgi:hypothetical protein
VSKDAPAWPATPSVTLAGLHDIFSSFSRVIDRGQTLDVATYPHGSAIRGSNRLSW